MTTNTLPKVTLKSPQGDTAEVSLHGAHLTSWKNKKGEELIFVSSNAIYQPPKAIRGGVPVCFPQFGTLGSLGQHGFARNTAFEVYETQLSKVGMALKYDGVSVTAFPHPFELRIITEVMEDQLVQTMEVINTGASPLSFTAALHTYFRVASIASTSVTGLSGLTYLDNMEGRTPKSEAGEKLVFCGEVDRVYVSAPDKILLKDGMAGRTIVITKSGFPDAVVWNPWVEKAKGMADFGDDEYKNMVCVEPAIANGTPVVLSPGAQWSGTQSFQCQ
jgi:glucose-6-phosphate 1-epimerase